MRKMMFAVLFLLALALAGCGKDEKPAALGEYEYNIFYLGNTKTKLVPQVYEASSSEMDGLIRELLTKLNDPPEDQDCQTAMIAEVQRFAKEDQVLYLYFGREYAAAGADREILCRAALVRTLTQIEGIDYVSIYCDEQPLLDSNGNPVGMMAASDFVEGISDVNSFEGTEVKLYFSNNGGDMLLPEIREVVHGANTSMEKLVVEALIEGPEVYGHNATLPADVKLLNVSVNDNTCYLNFDDGFLNAISGLKEYIPIYSIVNSLTELTNINKVQIVINGSQDVLYRGQISLAEPFERDTDYILGGDLN